MPAPQAHRNIVVRKGIVEIPSSDPSMRSFLVPGDLGNVRVNVWFNGRSQTYTVGTSMNHPVRGKTQLFRKNCSESEVLALLKNPRKHTGKGYRFRNQNPIKET